MGHNLVAIAYTGTNFNKETKTDVPETVSPSDFTFHKIQDGGGRHVGI